MGQIFSISDIPRILTLIFLEGALSLDNALAIALIVRGVPHFLRTRALFIGLASAIILRAVGILSAAFLIQLHWVQFLGGGYLLFLSLSRLFSKQRLESRPSPQRGFWKTVMMIELTDFIFAVDSILAGLALVGIMHHKNGLSPKLWIVYLGGILGIIFMRFAASLFARIIDKRPRLGTCAHLILGWIGLKLLIFPFIQYPPEWLEPLFLGRDHPLFPLWIISPKDSG